MLLLKILQNKKKKKEKKKPKQSWEEELFGHILVLNRLNFRERVQCVVYYSVREQDIYTMYNIRTNNAFKC